MLMKSNVQIRSLVLPNGLEHHEKLSFMLKCDRHYQTIILDLSCLRSEEILKFASKLNSFTVCNHWLLIDHPIIGMNYSVIEILSNLNINVNSEITLATPSTLLSSSSSSLSSSSLVLNELVDVNKLFYWMFDVWNPGYTLGGTLNMTFIGTYNSSYCCCLNSRHQRHNDNNDDDVKDDGNNNGFNMRSYETTVIRRRNLNGLVLRCMIVITNKLFEPFEKYLEHTYNPHLDSMNRFNYALLSHVKDMYNFTFRMQRTNSWGYLRNGTFDGMIGALHHKETDIGGSPIFFREERAKVVDYAARTWFARPCFIFRHPDTVGLTERNVFLQPFTYYVWISIFACGITFIIVLGKVLSAENYLIKYDNINERRAKENLKISVKNSMKRKRMGFIATDSISRNVIKSFTKYFTGGYKSKLFPQRKISTKTMKMMTTTSTMGNSYYEKSINDRDDDDDNDAQRTFTQRLKQKQQNETRNVIKIQNKQTGIIENNGNIKRLDGKSDNLFFECNGMGNRWHRKRRNIIMTTNDNNFDGGDDDDDDDCRVLSSLMKQTDVGDGTFSQSALLFLRAMCQQGSSNETPLRLSASRCVVSLIFLFAFCIYQFYSASIVGSLLIEKPKTIKTLRNLIDSSLSVGIEDIVYNRDFFTRTADLDALEIYRKKVMKINKKTKSVVYNFLKPIDGVRKIKAGGYAFHVDVATAYKIIRDTFSEREICELSEIELIPTQYMATIVQKGSPFRKIISNGLLRVTEAGLMNRQRKIWHSPKPKCVRQINSSDLNVKMKTMFYAILILAIGSILSFFILILETLVDRFSS